MACGSPAPGGNRCDPRGNIMIVYVSSQEMEDRGITFRRHASVPAGEVVHVVLPHRVDTTSQLLDLIRAALPGQRSMFLLIFNCHGINQPHIGNIGLKLSSGSSSEGGLLDRASLSNFTELAPWFSETNQGIEIHACQMARGLEGRLFCHTMANTTGVNVYAGLNVQRGTAPGVVDDDDPSYLIDRVLLGGGPDSWGYFEGPAMCFQPGHSSPHDASTELAARGAWRRGTPVLPTPYDVDLYEMAVPLEDPDSD